jgi:hypothetical protein
MLINGKRPTTAIIALVAKKVFGNYHSTLYWLAKSIDNWSNRWLASIFHKSRQFARFLFE